LSFAGISGPALLFGYSHGIKARWPGKIIRWRCGNAAGECWRQSLLLKAHQMVYFTEGEVDALNLVVEIPNTELEKSALLSDIEGKHVKVSGRIEMYKGNPEIRINAASQLEIE
jgi:hypothetical protein